MAEPAKLEHKPPASLPQQAQAQKNVGRPKRTPDDQAEYFYNQRNMHRLMFISSFLLLFSLVLMFWDDYWGVTPAKNRDWKTYQKVYQSAELTRLQFEIREIEESLKKDQGELDKLDRKITLEDEKLRSPDEIREVTVLVTNPKTMAKEPKTDRVNLLELEKQSAAILGEYQLKMQVMNFDKSELLTRRYHFDEAEYHLTMARKNKDPRLAHFEKDFDHARARWEEIQKTAEESKKAYDEVDGKKTKIDDQILALKANLQKMKADRAKLVKDREERLVRLRREKPQIANALRNAPMLDFFDPSIKIQQQIIPTILEDLNFVKVEKIDRCHTCHRGIDNPAFYAIEIFKDREAEEDRVVFKNKHLKAFVEHARGKTKGKCEVCEGVADGWMISPVAHGSWGPDEVIKYTKVLMAHPQPELYAAGGSPHALDKMGCTVCHGGDGRDTEFSRAVHMPDTDEQRKQWEKRHHYHYRHLWDAPMLPKRHLYSSCRACHTSEVELPTGDTYENDYIKGMKLYERAGCYACHRTDTYQILPKDIDPEKSPKLDPNRRFRRPGPPLTRIKDKVDPNWAVKWVLAPKSFRLATRMPHFFGQSNARTIRVNGAEVGPEKVEPLIAAAMIKYLFEVSSTLGYKPLAAPEKPADPVRGQAIFEQVGCRACHTSTADSAYARRTSLLNEDDQWRAPENESWMLKEFGPNLAGLASKFRDDPERGRKWIFNWIKDPKHAFEDSRMPVLRLTDQEAHDVTAWLMTLTKEGDFDQRPGMPEFGDAEHGILDTLIFEQLRSKLPDVDARDAVNAMKGKPAEKILWFGRKMVQNYGCYSCHEMNPEKEKDDPFLSRLPLQELPIDWTNIEGVGVELTGSQPEGNKAVDRLAFGYTQYDGVKHHGVSFDHAFLRKPYKHLDPENKEPDVVKVREFRHHWIKNKLLDPRVFDGGRLSSLPPDELLKMPNFYFNAEETRLLTTFVLSFTNQDVPLGLVNQAKKRLNEDEAALNRGHRIIRENNCRACHRLSLDRLEVEWTREETVSGAKKVVKSWEWIEGRRVGKLDDDSKVSLLRKWGLLPENPTPEDLKAELYTFDWVTDNCSLKMPGAVNPASKFVLVKGDSRSYLDTDGEKVNRELPIRRWRAVDGGEIQDLIVAYKKANVENWKDPDDNYLVDVDNPQALFSRFPPMLRTQGSKTQDRWLFDFLKSPHPIRPSLAPIVPGGKGPPDLNVRMPTFGFSDEEAASLVRFFWARDRLPGVETHPYTSFPTRQDSELESRKPVFEKVVPFLMKNCAECHYVYGEPPSGGFESSHKFAPEFANFESRFRERWLEAWLRQPGEIYPGTSMTAFWTQIPPEFAGVLKSPDDAVKATVVFLMNFKRLQAPPPPKTK
jgi:cytochrome c2